MDPEYMPWYHPGSQFLRCGGDNGCGAIITEGDIEVHNKWHGLVAEALKHARSVHITSSRGVW